MGSSCYICDATFDLRPYGPRGEMVCFECAFRSPQSTKETERMFAVQLQGSNVMSIDGSGNGPVPFNKPKNEYQ